MNKIYKLVWSKVRNTWVVASEIAKGHGKESSSGRNGKRLKLAVMTAILGGCFMTAGISPVAADLTGDQKAVYDAVMEKLNKDGVKKIHYLSIGPDNEKNLAQGGNYNNDGVEQHWGIAIGVNASSKDGDGIAMGMDSRSRGNQSIGLGSLSSAVGTYSTAVGHRSQAFGYSASAYGALARAYGANGVALGAGALVSNSKGLTKAEYDALPEEEKALYHTEIKQDDYYQYKQKTDSGKIEDIEVNGVAIGNYASSIGFGGVAIGDRAKASDKDNIENSKWGVALGASSQNKVDQGVALGASSVADRANNVKGYLPTTGKSIKYFEDAMEATGKAEAFNQFKKDYVAATAKLNEAKTAYEANTTDDTLKAAFEEAKKKVEDLKGQYAVMTAPWTSRRGAVSVGNDKTGFTRQITGVAAGSEDTDAVNVAQLKAVNKKVDKGAIHYVSVKPIDQSQAAGFNYLNDGAKGDGGIAIGQNAASQGRGIAIGYKSNATPKEGATLNLNSFEGIAIGQEAHMEVPGGIALGLRSKVEGTLNTQDGNVNEQGTVALGTDAYAKGNGAAAFGWKAKGIGEGAMAFGTETKAKESGTAFGGHANAAAGAVAMGWQANANDFVATSVGTSSDAGKQATAVGAAASATGRASTAVGLGSTSKGLQSTTIGALSVAEENGSVALGAGAVANTKAGAVGYIATGGSATFEEALATLDKKEDYDKWTATVNASKAEYDNLTKAFKDAPKGKKDEAKQALDEWKDKHADFIEALTAKEKLEATWRATKAAVSVGADGVDKAGNKIIESRQITNVAAGTQDTDAVNVAQLKALNTKVDQGAIHYFSVNSDDKNTPDGTNWKNDGATGNDAVAAGRYAKAYGNQSQATGRNAWSIGDYSQASGYNAVAAAEKGIDAAAYNALSEEEKENYKLNTQSEGTKNTSLYYRTKFKEYTNDEFNALSAMEQHRLTNEKGYRYDKEKEVWTLAPGAVAIGHAAKAIGLSTLAVGDLAEATAKYAVAVGRETEATDVGNTALGYYAKAKGLRSTALGIAARATDFESMAVGPYARAEGKVSLALGSNAHAKGNNSIAMGRRSESTGESSIALGGSAKTQAQGSVAIGMMAESRQKGSVALGEVSLADREAGVWGLDISTGKAMNEDALLGAGKADYDAAKAKLTELQGQAQTLRNEYQASLAKDPVAPNGNHIPSAATRDIGNKLRAKEGEVFAQTIQVNNFVKAWKATQSAISIGNKEKGLTRQITGLAAGTEDTDAVNVAQLKALAMAPMNFYFGGKKEGNTYTPGNTNWSMPLNEFRMDFGDGLKAEKVEKDGKTYTLVTLDKDSLKKDPAFKGEKGADGAKGADGTNGKSAYEIWKEKPGNDGKSEDDFMKSLKGDKGEKGADGAKGADGKSAYEIWKEKPGNDGKSEDDFMKSLKGDKGEKGADGAKGADGTNGKSAYEIWKNQTNDQGEQPNKDKSEKEFLEGLKGKDGKDGVGGASVEAGKNISVDKTNPDKTVVSLKDEITVKSVTAGGVTIKDNKVTGLAPGEISKGSKDAVNGSQLFATNQQVANNMYQINNLRDESREGDAMGAAMAALKPLDFDPYQRSQVMAGVGYYRGKEAVALGLAHYKNEDLMFHGGLAYAGNSELMANVGVSYRFGSKDDRDIKHDRNLRMPQYAEGPISSVYILQDEVDRLTKENKEANDRIAALEAKLEKVLEKVK